MHFVANQGPLVLRSATWGRILEKAVADAERQRRAQEPIPQVYMRDGKPIWPAARSDAAIPFKGRKALFRQLEDALGGGEGERATFLLYGQRRTGKTSVLFQLPRRLGSKVVPVFLDMQRLGNAERASSLLSGLAGGIEEEAQRNRSLPLPAIAAAALADDPYPAFDRWLVQVEGLLGDRTLLLCLDEYESLEQGIADGRLDVRVLNMLRSIIQNRHHIAVLLSGGHRLDELPPRWSSALINVSTLPISFLEEDDARELVEIPVVGFPAIYEPQAVDLILRLTHCHPFLIQLMCGLLVDRLNQARRMPPESYAAEKDVRAVVPTALERSNGYFDDLWRTQTGSEVAQRVLSTLANGRDDYQPKAVVRGLQADEAALRNALATLLRREIIEAADDGYRITVPLVAEYVRRQTML